MRNKNYGLSAMYVRLRRNALVLLTGSVAILIFGFVSSWLNAQSIGAKGVGVMFLFQSTVAIVQGFFSFGTQQPVIKIGREAIESGDMAALSDVVGACMTVDFLSSFFGAILGLFAVYFFSGWLGVPDDLKIFAYSYCAIILLSCTSWAGGVLRLLDKFKLMSLIQVIPQASLSVLYFFLYANGAGLRTYLLTYLIVGCVASVVLLVVAYTHVVQASGFAPKLVLIVSRYPQWVQLRSYLFTTSFTGTINSLRGNLDSLVLGFVGGAQLVGVYGILKQTAGALNKLSGIVSSIAFPEISLLAVKKDFVAARNLLVIMVRVGAVVGGVAVLFGTLFGAFFLESVFGADFGQGANALVAMIASAAIFLSAASFGGFVQAFISPEALLKINGVAFVAQLFLGLPSIYFGGLMGAACSQLVYSGLVWAGSWLLLHSFFRDQIHTRVS